MDSEQGHFRIVSKSVMIQCELHNRTEQSCDARKSEPDTCKLRWSRRRIASLHRELSFEFPSARFKRGRTMLGFCVYTRIHVLAMYGAKTFLLARLDRVTFARKLFCSCICLNISHELGFCLPIRRLVPAAKKLYKSQKAVFMRRKKSLFSG